MSIECRYLQFEPIDDESCRDHSKAGVSGILQVMAQRSQGQLGRRCSVYVRDWPQRRLRRWAAIKFPLDLLAERHRVERCEFRKNIMRMLMIDQRRSVVGFPGLKQLRESRMRRGQRLGGKHLAEKYHPRAKLVLLHQHAPIH